METVGKSIYRCTATYQGDRCKLARYHLRDAAIDPEIFPEPVHVGNFTMWDDAGVTAKADGADGLRKRNRRVNRILLARTGPGSRYTQPGDDAHALAQLGALVEFYSPRSTS